MLCRSEFELCCAANSPYARCIWVAIYYFWVFCSVLILFISFLQLSTFCEWSFCTQMELLNSWGTLMEEMVLIYSCLNYLIASSYFLLFSFKEEGVTVLNGIIEHQGAIYYKFQKIWLLHIQQVQLQMFLMCSGLWLCVLNFYSACIHFVHILKMNIMNSMSFGSFLNLKFKLCAAEAGLSVLI